LAVTKNQQLFSEIFSVVTRKTFSVDSEHQTVSRTTRKTFIVDKVGLVVSIGVILPNKQFKKKLKKGVVFLGTPW
jgi:hypothetical protein